MAKKKDAPVKTKPAAKKKVAAKKARKRSRKVVDYAVAQRAVARYRPEIMSLLPEAISFVGVGQRVLEKENRKLVSEVTISVVMRTKKDKQYLKKNADKLGFKKYYGGVGTDIIVANMSTAATVGNLEEGTKIFSTAQRTHSGTLGTKVTTTIDRERTVVWLTSAHVAWEDKDNPPHSAVSVFDASSSIGTVKPQHLFRDKEVDAAYIAPPTGTDLDRLKRRVMHHPKAEDLGKTVTFDGAQTEGCEGEIVFLDYEGDLIDTGEHFIDHLFIRHSADNYAKQGDSGSTVYLDGEIIGILRGADEKAKYSVVLKLENLARYTRNLGRGFRL